MCVFASTYLNFSPLRVICGAAVQDLTNKTTAAMIRTAAAVVASRLRRTILALCRGQS